MLLFFGVLFLVMLAYYNYRRRFAAETKKELQAAFQGQLRQARVEIQHHTLTYLAREIHDNVGQILSLAKIQLSSFREGDPIDFPLLCDARENVARSLQDLRNLARSIHIGQFRSFDIVNAVVQEAQRISCTDALLVSATSEGPKQYVSDNKQLILFRMIQECLTNAIKHGRPNNVIISFNWFPNQLRVRVRDDGQGFDVETTRRRSTGTGLQDILYRAHVTGGSCEIRSQPGEGTTVSIYIPYK